LKSFSKIFWKEYFRQLRIFEAGKVEPEFVDFENLPSPGIQHPTFAGTKTAAERREARRRAATRDPYRDIKIQMEEEARRAANA